MNWKDWIYPVVAFGLVAGVLVMLFGCTPTSPEPHPEPTCWPVVVIDSVEYCGGEG